MYIYIIIIILIIVITLLLITNISINDTFSNQKYKYGIVLCCYNRPVFLVNTLNSLSKSKLENSIICIIDDHSSDLITINLIKNFKIPNITIIKKRHSTNKGITKSLLNGFDTVYPLCKYLVNIDSDVIMKPDWLNKLKKTYEECIDTKLFSKDFIVTGFNCSNGSHSIVKSYTNFNIKNSIGGINMFYPKKLYTFFFRNVLVSSNKKKNHGWDWNIVKVGKKLGILFVTTKPSVIQHIGVSGLNSSSRRYDIAEDF